MPIFYLNYILPASTVFHQQCNQFINYRRTIRHRGKGCEKWCLFSCFSIVVGCFYFHRRSVKCREALCWVAESGTAGECIRWIVMQCRCGSSRCRRCRVICKQNDGSHDNVKTSVYDKDTGWDVPEIIDTSAFTDSRYPSIDVGPEGLHHVTVWIQLEGSAYNLYARTRLINYGWDESFLLETDAVNSVENPKLSMDRYSRTAIVVWRQNDGTEMSIWANRWVRGSVWGTAELVETVDSGSSLYPSIFVNPSGRVVVIWKQFNPSGFTIWANVYVPDKGWGSAERIDSSDPGNVDTPDVVMDEDENAISARIQHDTKERSVWANTHFKSDNDHPSMDLNGPENNKNCSSPVVTGSSRVRDMLITRSSRRETGIVR